MLSSTQTDDAMVEPAPAEPNCSFAWFALA